MKHFYSSILKLSLLTCLSLLSCNVNQQQKDAILTGSQVRVIKPDLSNFDFNTDIGPYLDTLKYVKLELTNASMIGEIDQIIPYNDRLYILDTKTSSLFVFTIDGGYLFKINTIGEGPQEYTQLDFFSIDYKLKNIVLTDLMDYWVIRYDMEGNFLSRQKIPFWVEGVAPIYDKGIALYANFRDNTQYFENEYNLYFLDSLNQIEKNYFPYKTSEIGKGRNRIGAAVNGGFYSYNEQCQFFRTYNDTIFQITPEGLSTRFIFDLGDNAFDQSYFNQHVDQLAEYVKKNKYYSLMSFVEDDQWASYTFTNRVFWLGFYNKKSGKTLTAFHYVNGDQSFYPVCVDAIYDSWFISHVSSESLYSDKETSVNNSFKGVAEKGLRTLLDSLNEDDNPVIVMYKLKDFK